MKTITPTQHAQGNPARLWIGAPCPGTKYTQQQWAAVNKLGFTIKRNRQAYDLPESYAVVVIGKERLGSIPETATYHCPTVSCTKDRKKLKVITPSGATEWVAWRKH